MPLIDALGPLTDRIWIYSLSVQGNAQRGWGNVQDVLRRHFAESREDIEAAVLGPDHPYWSQLRQDLLDVKERSALDLRIHV